MKRKQIYYNIISHNKKREQMKVLKRNKNEDGRKENKQKKEKKWGLTPGDG